MDIDFRRFSPCAKTPLRKTDQLVDYDLFLSETKIVRPHSCKLIRTDLQIEIPKNYHGEIFDRSCLALNFGLIVHNGVIDSNFRGVICFVLFNHSNEDYKILSGERIAQNLFKRHETVKFVETSELLETCRNSGGLGATGRF